MKHKYNNITIRRDLFDRLVFCAEPVDNWDSILRRLIDAYLQSTTSPSVME
ncbi:MAG TPA: hypothetical protein VFJ23_03950 [Candidatus Nitrosotalea sp.]|nr:hypothetical protein [Candidatus Nitrosotalea sp.]